MKLFPFLLLLAFELSASTNATSVNSSIREWQQSPEISSSNQEKGRQNVFSKTIKAWKLKKELKRKFDPSKWSEMSYGKKSLLFGMMSLAMFGVFLLIAGLTIGAGTILMASCGLSCMFGLLGIKNAIKSKRHSKLAKHGDEVEKSFRVFGLISSIIGLLLGLLILAVFITFLFIFL